jgi:hypothetical protein
MRADSANFTNNADLKNLRGTAPGISGSGQISMGQFAGKIGPPAATTKTFVSGGTTNTGFYLASGYSLPGSGPQMSDAKPFAGYIWIAVRYCGIYRSTDCTNWTQMVSGDYYGLFTDNGVLLAESGSSGYNSYVTTDGATFNVVPRNIAGYGISSVSRIGSTIVLGLQGSVSGTGNQGSIWYSTDNGASWTALASISGQNIINNDMLVGYWPSQNILLAFGNTTNRKFSSTDGINWTNLGTGSGTNGGLGGNQGSGGVMEIKTSTGQNALAWGVRDASTAYYTTDGVNYSSTDLYFSPGRVSWMGQVNGWYVMAPYWTGSVVWSETGQVWFTNSANHNITGYYAGLNGLLYYIQGNNTTNGAGFNWGYYDFSTVAPN